MQAIDAKNSMNLSDLTRDEKREIWMKRQGETLEGLAVVCGCGISALSRHFRNETMPTAHHQKLVEYGMPADTLPEPLDRPRGPKPRNAMPMTALAQAQ
jgi:hypothetical protein